MANMVNYNPTAKPILDTSLYNPNNPAKATNFSSNAPTVNVVKGSADEAILRAQYGNGVNFNYAGQNQFTGADRAKTNAMYQQVLGAPTNNAGDLNSYNGVAITNGYGPTQQPTQPAQPDMTAQINSLKQAQIDANVSALGKSRDSALSNLSAEKASIAPQYYADRNKASTQSQLGARNFAEFMAQRNGGNANQGVANQAGIANNVALQGNIGALNQQEQSANNDNARRVTDVQNGYASDVASANANANATALQNIINQMNADRTFGLQEAGLTGTYNGTQTMAGKQSDASLALSGAQLKEMTDPNSVTNQMSRIGLDTAKLNYSALPAQLQSQAQEIAQNLALGKINMQTAQAQLDFLPAQQAAELAQTRAQTSASNRANTGGSGGGSSSSKGVDGGKYSDSATASMKSKMDSALAGGATVDELISELDGLVSDGSAKLSNYNVDYLKNYLEGQRPATPTPASTPSSSLQFYQKWR